MSAKAFNLVPLVRVPLLLNSGIGLILSAISTSVLDSWWGNDSALLGVMSAVVSFFALSLLSTGAFVYTDHRRGGLRLPQKAGVPLLLLKAVADSAIALALLILHIVISVTASNSSDTILHMYAGFAALTASIFHGVLGTHSFIAVARIFSMTTQSCPTCNQRLRRCDSTFPHSAVDEGGPAFTRSERKGDESPVANSEGSLEGDSLIIPGGDEA